MKTNKMSKVALAFASLASVSFAFAATDISSRVEQLEKQMAQVGTENAFGGYGANTASARPSKDNNNWFITADVLYWNASVSGTEYAYSDNNGALSLPIKGRLKNISFDMDWGFRVGLGYNFCHDNWDVYANYTHFNTGGSAGSSGGCASSIVPNRGGLCDPGVDGANTFGASRAKSQFDLDLNMIDLNIGRNYFVSSNLSLRPLFGLKTAWVDLEQTTRFCGGENGEFCGIQVVALGGDTYKISQSSDYWGLGPEIGVNTQWHLARGFSLFADVMGSLLYGFFDVDDNQKYTGDDTARIKISANEHRMVPNVQIFAGVGYDVFFDCDRQHFGIRFGYDAQYFWRVNQMLGSKDTINFDRISEDMSLNGVTLSLRWDF